MRFIRNRRVVATIVAASCVAVPASASASADLGPVQGDSDSAAQSIAPVRSDAAQLVTSAGTDRSDAAQSGAAGRTDDAVTFPPAGFRGGDTKSDAPGIGVAPPVPTTIEVVRPERTIVRDVDEALPLILSGTALILVLAGLAFTLLQTRVQLRRSH
jgi:hypothetical protein